MRWAAVGAAVAILLAAGTGRTTPARNGASDPRVADLPDNTALDLGRYRCREPADNPAGCERVTDYSRLTYDAANRRMLLFGGGHAGAYRTDIDAFDLRTLSWRSLGPSTPCREMTPANLDTDTGSWRSSGHPTARHTYDMMVVADVRGTPTLLLMTGGGYGGESCGGAFTFPRVRLKIAAYDLAAATSRWRFSRVPSDEPWYYASAAEWDPVARRVAIIGPSSQAGAGSLWLYDPDGDRVTTARGLPGNPGYGNNLVFFPPNGRLYYFARGTQTRVWEVSLDATSPKATAIVELAGVTGTGPASGRETGFAYDAATRIIGGGIENGVFHAFDPLTRTWTSSTMDVRSSEGARPGTVAFHALDYDPIGNVFVFVTDQASGRRTWAYRHRRLAETQSTPPFSHLRRTASGSTPGGPAPTVRGAR